MISHWNRIWRWILLLLLLLLVEMTLVGGLIVNSKTNLVTITTTSPVTAVAAASDLLTAPEVVLSSSLLLIRILCLAIQSTGTHPAIVGQWLCGPPLRDAGPFAGHAQRGGSTITTARRRRIGRGIVVVSAAGQLRRGLVSYTMTTRCTVIAVAAALVQAQVGGGNVRRCDSAWG